MKPGNLPVQGKVLKSVESRLAGQKMRGVGQRRRFAYEVPLLSFRGERPAITKRTER